MTDTAADTAASTNEADPNPDPGQPERPDVEVMPAQPEGRPPAVADPPSALQRAAEELLATPGAPRRDEFLTLAATARILSMSQGAPKAVRQNPWLAFHLALVGRDLGISPSAAIAQVDVIGEGDNAQLSISPELVNAQIRRMGLGSIVPAASTPTGCTAVALLPGGRLDPRCAKLWPEHAADGASGGRCRCTLDLVLGEESFTWADAQQAGLAHRDCAAPDQHTKPCLTGKDAQGKYRGDLRCHQGYRTYPKRMFFWRSAAHCASTFFPEASIGIYTTEQLGAVVDPETGRPYDPATVELPEGYQPPERPADPGDDLLADAEEGSDLHRERLDLAARVDAIKAAGGAPVAALRELWEQEDDEGRRRTPPLPHLRRRHLVRARAVVKSVEDRVKKGEWGDDAKRAWADASVTAAGFGEGRPQQPQDEPDAPDGESTPEGPAAPESEAQAPQAGGSSTAAAVRRIRRAVGALSDERVYEEVEAHQVRPAEEADERRTQLVALLLAAEEREAQESPPGAEGGG